MSAIWLKFSTILCLCCTAEMKVVWKKPGQSITIQCKSSSDYESLQLKKGINEETIILTKHRDTGKETINTEMIHRVQTHGKYLNVDILIKDLNENDTDVYCCMYTKLSATYTEVSEKGQGSILLVVAGSKPHKEDVRGQPNLNMTVVYIVIAVGVLLIIMLVVICRTMQKTKTSLNTVKPRRIENTNDVYEDMRGTIRRS